MKPQPTRRSPCRCSQSWSFLTRHHNPLLPSTGQRPDTFQTCINLRLPQPLAVASDGSAGRSGHRCSSPVHAQWRLPARPDCEFCRRSVCCGDPEEHFILWRREDGVAEIQRVVGEARSDRAALVALRHLDSMAVAAERIGLPSTREPGAICRAFKCARWRSAKRLVVIGDRGGQCALYRSAGHRDVGHYDDVPHHGDLRGAMAVSTIMIGTSVRR